MRMFKKRMSRAEAIVRAIDASAPGDTVEIHESDCFFLPGVCICADSKVLIVSGGKENPIGFRMRNERS